MEREREKKDSGSELKPLRCGSGLYTTLAMKFSNPK